MMELGSGRTVEELPVSTINLFGPHYIYFYAGPNPTGTIEIELKRLNY